jgi:RsiW-degrading membrane proteinase PrsW (M82 family)
MNSVGSYTLLIVLGFLPSLIWLGYWLRKDNHPEPKMLITKTLLLGIMLSPLAILFQLLFAQYVSRWVGIDPKVFSDSPWFYLWAAFIEELVKFLAVYFIVLRSPEFDEPVDAMVYMLTAAMGFAAMENILVINRVIGDGVTATIGIWGLRFAGATLLHALSSALLGYFIALAWFYFAHRKTLFVAGLALATVFHWVFNLFISQMQKGISLLFSTLLLMAMAFLISALFDKIKERDNLVNASTC